MSLIPKKGTVYVVDDDEAVRDSLQSIGRRRACQVPAPGDTALGMMIPLTNSRCYRPTR